jgi:hypothetical protein
LLFFASAGFGAQHQMWMILSYLVSQDTVALTVASCTLLTTFFTGTVTLASGFIQFLSGESCTYT